jgi:hypothetical protein
MTIKKSGELQYTARAFKQDAEDAMKGDVIRALIELITNADDAYNSNGGKIQIRFHKAPKPFQAVISVHDQATGLSAAGLETAFARLGDLNKKFVGDMGTRGLFGRGAKDVAALGKARFSSIKHNKFSTLEINPVDATFGMENIDENPTDSSYAQCLLNPGQAGLTAQLFVNEIHRIPGPVDLVHKLQSHVQLRDLLNRNEVSYFDERNQTEIQLKGIEPTGEKLIDISLDIPKYKHPIHLVLYKLPTKETSVLDEYSNHGLVISGRGAAYENSFLHLTRRPEAGWFCGKLDAPEIHDLARSIDIESEGNALNPTRIVSRQRDGLVQNHPYYRALAAELDKILKPLFDEMAKEEGSQRKESEKLRKKFDAISQVLANTLQEILNENDAGELPTESGDDGSNNTLIIIPPRRILKVGETVSLTIRAPQSMAYKDIEVLLESITGEFSIDPKAISKAKWENHPRLVCVQKNINVTALSKGLGKIIAHQAGSRAECELIAVHFEPVVEVEPLSIEFVPSSVKVAPGKGKNLLIKGPLQNVGENIKLFSDNAKLDLPDFVILKSSKSGKSAEVYVHTKAGNEEGVCIVSAALGEVVANCRVNIEESSKNKNPKIRIEVVGNENPPRRVDTLPEEGQLVIRIYGRHKSLTRILGRSTDAGFEFESSPEAQASIVEIVAQQLSNYAVERDAEKNPDRYLDAPSIFFRQQDFIPRFVIALQTGLLG